MIKFGIYHVMITGFFYHLPLELSFNNKHLQFLSNFIRSKYCMFLWQITSVPKFKFLIMLLYLNCNLGL